MADQGVAWGRRLRRSAKLVLSNSAGKRFGLSMGVMMLVVIVGSPGERRGSIGAECGHDSRRCPRDVTPVEPPVLAVDNQAREWDASAVNWSGGVGLLIFIGVAPNFWANSCTSQPG